MKRILCPVDLSERSTDLLQYAAAVQHWYGGCVTVLHLVPTFDAVELHPGSRFDPVKFAYPTSRDSVIAASWSRRVWAAANSLEQRANSGFRRLRTRGVSDR